MNIYLLTQEEEKGDDTYDSCIVYAESKEEAVNLRPDGYTWENMGYNYGWASKKENVKCELVGVASDNVDAGILLYSFNAG